MLVCARPPIVDHEAGRNFGAGQPEVDVAEPDSTLPSASTSANGGSARPELYREIGRRARVDVVAITVAVT